MSNLPGNIANVIMVVSTLLYLVAILYPNLSIFTSSQYLREGFCVYDNPSLWYLNSHLLCVYVDAVSALCLHAMSGLWREYEGMAKVKENCVGIIGHGFGHFFLYLNYPPTSNLPYLSRSYPEMSAILISSVLFFYMFFLSISLIPKSHRITLSILNGSALVALVPQNLGFTYVQSTLLLTAAFYEALEPEKSPWYNDFSLLVHLPVSIAGWVEGAGCEGWVRGIGGHVIYDATIPMGIAAFAIKRRLTEDKVKEKTS